MKNKKQLKAGDLVQVWDWYREKSDRHDALKLQNHGDIGYLVKRLTETEKHVSGSEVWEVIFFGQDPPARSSINSSWLHKIDKSSDIRRVEDEQST